MDNLERQIRRNKTKLEKKFHGKGLKLEDVNFEEKDVDEEHNFKIVKTKICKANDCRRSCFTNEFARHEFFMFSNAETQNKLFTGEGRELRFNRT